MSLSLTILGCGSSAGVPRVAQGWGACDPNNPRNRRRRCSVLVAREGLKGRTQTLVDTSPDLREQLIDANVPAPPWWTTASIRGSSREWLTGPIVSSRGEASPCPSPAQPALTSARQPTISTASTMVRVSLAGSSEGMLPKPT